MPPPPKAFKNHVGAYELEDAVDELLGRYVRIGALVAHPPEFQP